MLNQTKNRTEIQRNRARRMRSDMSVSEKVLWNLVRKDRLGFRFKRQVPVLDYILDFYCAEAWLVIEIDGEQHLESAAYDADRDARLAERGIETLRIPSLWLFDAAGYKKADKAIREALHRRTGRRPIEP